MGEKRVLGEREKTTGENMVSTEMGEAANSSMSPMAYSGMATSPASASSASSERWDAIFSMRTTPSIPDRTGEGGDFLGAGGKATVLCSLECSDTNVASVELEFRRECVPSNDFDLRGCDWIGDNKARSRADGRKRIGRACEMVFLRDRVGLVDGIWFRGRSIRVGDNCKKRAKLAS